MCLRSCFLLLPKSLQEQPHGCSLESDALHFVLNLVFEIAKTQRSMHQDHCSRKRRNEVRDKSRNRKKKHYVPFLQTQYLLLGQGGGCRIDIHTTNPGRAKSLRESSTVLCLTHKVLFLTQLFVYSKQAPMPNLMLRVTKRIVG